MKRLSLAELKAKTNVVAKTEFITGGNGGEDGCHFTAEQLAKMIADSKLKL